MTRNSRNKKHEQGTGAFQNTPFKALKGIAPKASVPPAPPTAPKASSSEELVDDDELFLRSMSGTRRIDPAGEQEPVPLSPVKAVPQPGDEEDNRELFLRAMGALTTATFRPEAPEPDETEPTRSPSSRMRQLKRGTIRIGDELDLHGFLKDEALKRLEHFIAGAYARGLQAVLVITGKGINSPEGPVLPGAAAAWLREKGKAMIAESHPAPRDKGGSGAIVIFLRKREGIDLYIPQIHMDGGRKKR
ncbi:MAG: Smr/MutS family protein [Nitrospirota bacterium]